ncbi:CPBP family intramembrane metalloprotease [Nocardia terpenica]|uniref:CPBP family intramembrane glutamic endopeptidase n=1 Tax=Nocardia terpenica TaxID=455432 RepID=UPI0018947958|nr:CPBP family intramembrane glutamic endopeptidase [Nocardia terpenica]MBF6107041.1 CPBP family intramembrane metalloprotease [Nocardia terpenica]MBF6114214.1 CPBP family intramembrane metalloprotease [Nocardia terpenica]
MKIFCVLFLLYLVVAESYFEIHSVRKFTQEFGGRSDARIRLYQGGVARTWLALAAVFVAFAASGTSLTKLGLGGFDTAVFRHFTPVEKVVALAIAVVYVGYLLIPAVVPLTGRAGREFIARKIEYVVFITPANRSERFWWIMNSLSTPAEEIVYRGFTIYAVDLLFPNLPFWVLIILAAGVVDGLRHAFRPMVSLQVIFGGVALALLYQMTGSLWLTIAVKLFHDFRVLAFPLDLARRNLAEKGLSEIPGKTSDPTPAAVGDAPTANGSAGSSVTTR